MLAVPALLVFVFRRYLPESARYLLSRGDVAGCNHSLTVLASGKLRHPGPDTVYLDEATGGFSLKREKVRLGEVFGAHLRRRTLTGLGAYWTASGAQMSATILMPVLLVSQGFSIQTSLFYTMIMQIGSVFGALTAFLYTHRFPRRRVLLAAAVASCLSALAFGLIHHSTASILIIGAIFQFCVMLLMTTIWSWAPELFPTRIRGFGVSVVRSGGGTGIIILPPVIASILDGWGAPGCS